MRFPFRARHFSVALIACTAILLVGCSSSKKAGAPVASAAPPAVVQPAAAAPATPAAQTPAASGASPQTAVATVQASGSQAASVTPLPVARSAGAPAATPRDSDRVLYFDYDSFTLRDEAKPIIEAHARRLMSDRSQRMLVEGHADERGSHEYNLALGQKRADAVVRALTLVGAPAAQLEAVSFGEERPAVRAANEEAWSKNRRVELKDRR